MLPQSKMYLISGGYSPRNASFMLIGLFLVGVIGIRVLSSAAHQFMPSHVVDCDHTHDEEAGKEAQEEMSEHAHDDDHTREHSYDEMAPVMAGNTNERTPLIRRSNQTPPMPRQFSAPAPGSQNGFVTAPSSRRPSMMPRTLTRTLTKYMTGRKDNCDEGGPCLGFSDPCGQDCFKAVQRRNSTLPTHPNFFARSRAPTWSWQRTPADMHAVDPVPEIEEPHSNHEHSSQIQDHAVKHRSRSDFQSLPQGTRSRSATHHFHHPENEHFSYSNMSRRASQQSHSVGAEHHHHVPTNAFMSIGLQTSLAIALHKAPEGFITYATNHANPTLGFAVFMALFIHNITEGFAMSLPLYLALNSRLKAILWSSLLGGVSQPLGAGIAALWFKLAKKTSLGAPTEGVYGGMFAITAGVMTSVALSLFSESLQLSHNKGTCIAFAFLGMAILGVSGALTAK